MIASGEGPDWGEIKRCLDELQPWPSGFDFTSARRELEVAYLRYHAQSQEPSLTDCVNALKKLAGAADSFSMAFDPSLFYQSDIDGATLEDYERVVAVADEIADRAEREAISLSQQLKRRQRRGHPQTDRKLMIFLGACAEVWCDAGGSIGGQGDGPFGRYLKVAVVPLIEDSPSIAKIRGWIRALA